MTYRRRRVPRWYLPPDYDIESLRQQMGVVTQESILFNDTIFNNIAFGMPMSAKRRLFTRPRCHAHNFIMETEKGYQTLIGERGSKLSGGQRQRLSIARACSQESSHFDFG